MQNKKKPELLIPASCLEVLKIAVLYGADAVYIGGEAFGLRAKARNFSMKDMEEGIRFAHAHGVKVHVTVNILAHNRDLEGVRAYLSRAEGAGTLIRAFLPWRGRSVRRSIFTSAPRRTIPIMKHFCSGTVWERAES